MSEKAIKSEVADGTSSPPVDAQSEFYSRLARASFGPDIGITANICIIDPAPVNLYQAA